MEVWFGLGVGGAAAGSTYYPMEFTNLSSHACHLVGFPGVSAWNGHQVGTSAQWDRSFPKRTVTLTSGATAHTILQIMNVSNFPHAACKPTAVSEIKVYPPNSFSAAYIPFRFDACSVNGPVFLSVRPIQAGVGVPGQL
jgi:hypothetical protein